jgi:hypothetical protein
VRAREREGPLASNQPVLRVSDRGTPHPATQADMATRRARQSSPRRRPQHRFYLLRGIVHCATGHNALRMQGKERKGNIYYACGYRASYGDNAAAALGHGKWQYIREDRLTGLIDRFFKTYIFGPNAVAHFRSQHAALAPAVQDRDSEQRGRLTDRLADFDQRIARQIAAIESGIDPLLVGERIDALKAERHETETALAGLDIQQQESAVLDLEATSNVLDSLPDLSTPLAKADPELRRRVYEAFQFGIELDRNKPEVRLKALVSSAFSTASNLDDLAVMVADKPIGTVFNYRLEPSSGRFLGRLYACPAPTVRGLSRPRAFGGHFGLSPGLI